MGGKGKHKSVFSIGQIARAHATAVLGTEGSHNHDDFSGLFICVRQVLDVAKGLEYLHSLGIPHGAVKAVRYFPHKSYFKACGVDFPNLVFNRIRLLTLATGKRYH